MLDFQEDILPVVDSEKKIVGELRLSDLYLFIQKRGYATINNQS